MIYLLVLAVFVTAFVFVILQKWTVVLVTLIAAVTLLLINGLIRLLLPARRPEAVPAAAPAAPPPGPAAPVPLPTMPVPQFPAGFGPTSVPPVQIEIGRNTVLSPGPVQSQSSLPFVLFVIEICLIFGLTILLFLK